MRRVLPLLLAFPLLAASTPPARAQYGTFTLTRNKVAVQFASYGTMGNLFVSRSPSLEYPNGSGYEHLTDAGIWIGARTRDGGGIFTAVSTAAEDAPLSTSIVTKTEFTPADFLVKRSTLPESPYYSPMAVSEFDVIAQYADTPAKSGTSEAPRPLGVAVRQSAYSWNTPQLDDIVFVRYVVRAQADTLKDLWIGHFAELASGNKSAYTNWPPSSSDPGGMGAWFSKKLVVWDASTRLLREHYCRNQPVPSGCQFAIAPPWMGLQLLTPPGAGQSITVAAWPWNPNDPSHNTDAGRYAKMSAGTIADFTTPSLAPQTGDPVEVLALGPWAVVPPGDSVVVDFAFVGGADEGAIATNAVTAQAMRDGGFDPAVTAVEVPPRTAPGGLRVAPNPAGHDARVEFTLARAGTASVRVLDVAGRVVRAAQWGALTAGPQSRVLDLDRALPPGLYLVELRTEDGATARTRMVLVR